ncbi:hypothetical protein C3495_03225 [Clostridiaceae bacterium 14S0207]|nr:hypothetical protein C3495_03225 [Clostridiaceae bacterium 14S0207]
MIKLKQNSKDYLNGFTNLLSGYFDLEECQRISLEFTFLNLLSEALYSKDKFIYKEIKGNIDFNLENGDTKEFFNKLHIFINENACLKNIINHIFKLEKLENKNLIKKIITYLNEFYTDGVRGQVFKKCIDTVFKTTKIENITSPNISKLIRILLRNFEFKSLYDPTIGNGNLITEIAIKRQDIKLYGQDINENVINICKMLLIISGRIQDIKNIHIGNSITNPKHIIEGRLQKFDCIVSEPPFFIKDWGYNEVINDKYNRFYRGLPSKSLGDYAFITHIVESLDEKGMAVVVEPSGVLFRKGSEGKIREALIEENLIDCIIALPNNMMYGTTVSTNILIFKKNRKREEILFIDVINNVESSKVLTVLQDSMIEKIVTTYENYVEQIGFSKVVSRKELMLNNNNLSVQRYVESLGEREELNIEIINKKMTSLQKNIKEVQKQLDSYLNN